MFNTESDDSKYWKLERGLSTSIAAYVASRKPNEVIEAMIAQSARPFELLNRQIYPGVTMRLIDELGVPLHVQVLNRFFTQFAVIDSVTNLISYPREFCYLMTKVPHSDLIDNLSLNGIKAVLCAKTLNTDKWPEYGDTYPLFVFYSMLKNDNIEDLTLAFRFIKANLDIQVAGAKPWFDSRMDELDKSKAKEILQDKSEALSQIAAMKELAVEKEGADFTLLELAMTLANNATAVSGKSIYDQDNALFLEQLTAQTKLLMNSCTDFENRYHNRNDSAAMFVTAMVVHEKTRRIFSNTVGDDSGPEEHFKLDY
ncbi:MAG: hypothetical protein K2W88_00400 [Pararheinheimera sp.]|nr:hypothetical protein [Rheinheimera sp.]